MRRKPTTIAAMLLLVVLLVTLPGLVGCGEEQTKAQQEIVVGLLGDATGPSAFALGHIYDGINDYFRMVNEESLVPGVKIAFHNFDTRASVGRAPIGYQYMRGKNAEVIVVPIGTHADVLKSRCADDEIVLFGMQGSIDLMGSEWVFVFNPPFECNLEALMKWLLENWDQQQKPKVGIVGTSGMSGTELPKAALEKWIEQNPGEVDYAGAQLAPSGSRTWAAEIARLKDCDWIVMAATGPPGAAFVKEARDRGYKGRFIGGVEHFLPWHDLFMSALPSSDYLKDTIITVNYPLITDQGSFIAEYKEYTYKYLPADEAEVQLRHTGRLSGWATALFIVDAISRAIEKVGAENVDGGAIKDALEAMDLTLEGWGNTTKKFL